ncbi:MULTISPECIES: DnaD domain protein [Bacillus cereus group]|uniref:DnaD domain protein n=3 Tax=Bacillus thuringiensis TaxID=1428 RepID=A0AAP4V024_BACTU|nr:MULTISPECIES: DnaD domain protein [Bacillus cereus group]MEC2878479.1 DnaD domain protein [Bacillus cereus]AGG04914.1 DNA replication protein [Bacillus thuringiensis serovar thuringiensis str. IS5056]ARP61499.1 DNA-binding protein [Bacillus thuringiensis]EEM32044.1 Phage replication protein [Bacillus thuringiensis serovar thuringiensis str. T01001]EEM62498.1 Phage replication protein [Bacillus thuringiensis serovar berliner ATCC 10792]
MGIFRVKKDNNYSVINNTGLKDKRLSWKAKGILAYILTLPDDWVFYREELSKHAKDGINSLRAGMQELKEYGYIKRFPVRDEKNKIVRWETIIYEIPVDDYPPVENPPAGKPVAGNLPVENHKLLNINIQSTKELNTDIQNINHRHDNKQKLISQRLINDDFKISHQFLMKNRISLSEIAIRELGVFCESLGSELIGEAVNRSIDENVPKWRYVRGILKKWETKKVKTLKDVAMLDAQFDLGKNKKQFGSRNTNRSEMVPEWLHEKEDVPEEQPIKNNELTIEEERERLKTLLKKYKS